MTDLLERAWPEGTAAQRAALLADEHVRVDERITRNADRHPDPDALILVETGDGEEAFGLPEADTLSRGDGWVVVSKAFGMPGALDRDDPMNPVLFLADMLGLEREGFTPVWEMPTTAGGPWLFGLSPEDAEELRGAYMSGRMMMTWVALVPSFGVPRGQFTSDGGVPVDYAVSQMQGGLWEVQLTPQFHERHDEVDPVEFLLELLADKAEPVLGDRERGGYMVDGGLRLRLAALYDETSDIAYSWSPGDDWWPEDSIVPPPEEEEAEAPAERIPDLQVSAKTMDVLGTQRHPWVLADRKTGNRDHLHPGTLVRLHTEDGRRGPWALVEGTGELAARVWGWDEDEAGHIAQEIDTRVDEAFAKRRDLLRSSDTTDLFRLIHGEADGLPGFYLDRVGSLLRATLMGGASEGFRRRVYENIADFDPGVMILEVSHLADVRKGELPDARIIRRGSSYVADGERIIGQEDGLKFWCEPWEGIDVGFFADQRENRRRLVELAEPGERWLNLFCHTGAFSVALAARGVEVVSVDLSRRYLDWLEENLELNELDPSLNTSIAEDAREFVDGCDDVFDGIIVDPPTAAASDAGFWSVRQDYEDLLVGCIERLAEEGTMLVCRNEKRPSSSLRDIVASAAERAGRQTSRLEPAPPADDYPHLDGFPEGDSFEGVWVHLSRE